MQPFVFSDGNFDRLEAARTTSEAESEKSLKVNQDQMRLEQRAWVGLSQIEITHTHPQLSDMKANVLNSGRTPANEVHTIIGDYVHSGDYIPAAGDEQWIDRILRFSTEGKLDGKSELVNVTHYSKEVRDAVIANQPPTVFMDDVSPPGVDIRIPISTPKSFTLEPLIPSIPYSFPLPGNWTVFGQTWIVYGKIWYKDIFNKDHTTRFCFYRLMTTEEFSACPVANKME